MVKREHTSADVVLSEGHGVIGTIELSAWTQH